MSNSKIIYTPAVSRSLSLDGSHYLSINNSALNIGVKNFAVDALIYVDPTYTGECYIAHKLSSAPQYGYSVSFYTNKLYAYIVNNGTAYSSYSDSTITLGQWQYLRWQYDRSGTIKFYINGVNVGTKTVTATSAYNVDNSGLFNTCYGVNSLKGYVGFVRLDLSGRLLSDIWVAEEWDRIYYGLPREIQDFSAMWTFPDSLYDLSSNLYLLTYNGGGSPSYTTGYPSTAISYTFTQNYRYGRSLGYLETDSNQRAIAGDLYSYRGPRKKRFALEFDYCQYAQLSALQAAYYAGGALDFYEDADKPKTCSVQIMVPPGITELSPPGYYNITLELEET